MKKLFLLLMCVYLDPVGAYSLTEVKSSPGHIEFVFDAKPVLLNNLYLTTDDSLILDFNPFSTKTTWGDVKHLLLDKLEFAATDELSRILLKFKQQVTYRIEREKNSLKVHVAHKPATKDKLAQQKDYASLRTTLKNLADKSGIDLVISDKITGEAIMQLSPDTDPQAAMLALVEANNLALKKSGSLWLITLPKPSVKKPVKKVLTPKFTTDLINLRYAKASDLVNTIKSAKNTLLSAKGSVSADERTNTLLINDTKKKIYEIRNLVRRLDKPRKQVLIQSKIVIATDDFARSLGVRFGISHYSNSHGVNTGVSGNAGGANSSAQGQTPVVSDRFMVNLPARNPTSSIGLVIAKLPYGTMLDLELSASQLEGKTKIVASPHVMTADGATAYIQQGVEIPYRTETSEKIDVKFKEALMELRVMPRITPHNHIILELIVKKDAVGSILCLDCEPSIDTREVKTKVRIKNGETLVIGGISEDTITRQRDSVPGISRIPILGKLFRRKSSNRNKRELLIFITPSIVSG